MENRDYLSQLGFLSFVTRLKRVSDSMIHDGRRLYKELGMDIEPNWYVIFKLLEEEGELTVTEIAERIGFSHPSVITIVNKMVNKGYLVANQCSRDSRRRLLILSEKAKREMPKFESVWNAGIAGLKNMLGDTDALAFLDLIESRIGEAGFKRRTIETLNRQGKVKIHEYKPKFGKDFARLNYEWISEMYEIEDHDREQLDHPEDYIIKPGGQILMAEVDGEMVGTVALIECDGDSYELAKMAVTSEFRGLNIGRKLMLECIEYSKKVGKKRIILESNTRNIPAIKLYRKFGFKEIPLDPDTPYERANIRMELKL